MTNIKRLPIAQVFGALAKSNQLSDIHYTDKYLQGLYTYRQYLNGDAAYYSEDTGLSLTPAEYLFRKLEIANFVYISTKTKWMYLTLKPLQLELELTEELEQEIVP